MFRKWPAAAAVRARETMTQLTLGREVACRPVWTPDGEYVVFATKSRGRLRQAQQQRNIGATAGGHWHFPDTVVVFARRQMAGVRSNESQTSFGFWAAPVDRTGGTLR